MVQLDDSQFVGRKFSMKKILSEKSSFSTEMEIMKLECEELEISPLYKLLRQIDEEEIFLK